MATQVGVGYVSIIPSTAGFGKALTAQTTAAGAAAGAAASKSVGAGMSASVGAIAKKAAIPVAALAAGGLAAAESVDKATKSLIMATGAKGSAAEGLKESFKTVAGQTGASFDKVSATMTDLWKRLGHGGPMLEELTLKFLRLSKVTGEDVTGTTTAITQLMNKWNMDIRDAPSLLDRLTVAYQKTGVPVTVLAESLTKNSAALKAAGYSMDDSIALLAELQKSGINSTQAMTGLRTGLSKLAKAGKKDLPAAMRETFKSIKEAKTEGEALGIAAEIFGSRAGPELALAIRSGKLSVEDLGAALDNSNGALDRSAKAGMTLEDRFKKLKNQVVLALAPLGEALLPLIEKYLIPALTKMVGWVKAAADWFGGLSDNTKKVIGWIGLLIVMGPILKTVLSPIAGLVRGIAAAFGLLNVALLSNPIFWIVAAIVVVVVLIVAGLWWLYNKSEKFRKAWDETWQKVKKAIGDFMEYWKKEIWPLLKDYMPLLESAAVTFIQVVGGVLIFMLQGIKNTWDVVKPILKEIKPYMEWLGVIPKSEAGPNNNGGAAFASGGRVPGRGSGDTFPAMLTPGEYVLTKGQVATVGTGALDLWRAGGPAPGGKGGFTVEQLVINNPQPEPASDSLPRTVRKLAYLGGGVA